MRLQRKNYRSAIKKKTLLEVLSHYFRDKYTDLASKVVTRVQSDFASKSTFPSCSRIPEVFYDIITHGFTFFIYAFSCRIEMKRKLKALFLSSVFILFSVFSNRLAEISCRMSA